MPHPQRRRLNSAARLALAALSIALVFSTSCRKTAPAPSESEPAPSASAVRPVRVFTVGERSTSETFTFPLIVRSAETSKLSFRVPGRIEENAIEIGRRFQEGETVAKLDPRDYQLMVDRANQALVEAHAALKAMETGARPEDVASAEAALNAAKSQRETAEKQFARMESLRKDGAASEMQYDLAKTALDGALAAEQSAEKTLEKAKKGSRIEEIEMAKAKIAGLEIDLQLAENKLADVVLTAPFAGVISEKFFESHESVAPGAPIATLVRDDAFEAELNVTEDFTRRREDVATIECAFDALPGKTFPASLKFTSTSTQKGNRAYLATISLEASPEDGVLIGMAGSAKISVADPSGRLTVPASALIAGDDGSDSSCVWIVSEDGSSAQKRAVKVGDLAGDRAEILEGLEGGERIVGAGARFLREGQPIRVSEDAE